MFRIAMHVVLLSQASIHIGDEVESYQHPATGAKHVESDDGEIVVSEQDQVEAGLFSFRLEELAYARSGDKGNNCNIG